MATNYTVNYDDERFREVEKEKQEQLNTIDNTYNNMINNSDSFYQKQIDAANEYKDTQTQLQNEQTQLSIDEINQQKDKLQKDYIKEQKGAYADWQKESNRYGVNAETQASNGLRNTGYSESSQVSMYNQYQSRVATARETYNTGVQNYDRSIAQARLSNNSKLAEIAYNTLQTTLELGLNGFQYKNQLLLNQIEAKQNVDNTYYSRWQNVLSQINTENALAEQVRQYNENMAYQKERDKVSDEQWQKEYNLTKKSYSSSSKTNSSGSIETELVDDSDIDSNQSQSSNIDVLKNISIDDYSDTSKVLNAMKPIYEAGLANDFNGALNLLKTYNPTVYNNIITKYGKTATSTNKAATSNTASAKKTTAKTSTSSSSSKTNSNASTSILKSTSTPSLHNKKAQLWYKSISNKSYTKDSLIKLLNNGVKTMMINESDKNKIFQSYGI